jgi:phasin family protein
MQHPLTQMPLDLSQNQRMLEGNGAPQQSDIRSTHHPHRMRLHMTTTADFKAAQESSIDTFFRLAGKTFEGIEKLAELNLQTIKTLISEAQETALTVLSIKDLQELVTLQSGLLKPTGEKAAAYARHVREIVAATRAEFTKEAEVSVTEARRTLLAAVDSAAKSAPAGSEHAVALVKTAVETASSAAEGMQLAVKQATEAADAGFDNIIDVEPKS